MKTLYEILENISIESSDKLIENDFIDLIAEKMPGYSIEIWNMDEFGNDLTAVIANYIIDEAQNGKTDIQYAEWNTDNMDAYYAVVASKNK
jgi:hypothetical protein